MRLDRWVEETNFLWGGNIISAVILEYQNDFNTHRTLGGGALPKKLLRPKVVDYSKEGRPDGA